MCYLSDIQECCARCCGYGDPHRRVDDEEYVVPYRPSHAATRSGGEATFYAKQMRAEVDPRTGDMCISEVQVYGRKSGGSAVVTASEKRTNFNPITGAYHESYQQGTLTGGNTSTRYLED